MQDYSAKRLIRSLSDGQARQFMGFVSKGGKSTKMLELFKLVRKKNRMSDSRISEAMGIPFDQVSAYMAMLASQVIDFLAYKQLKANKGLHQYLRYKAMKEVGFLDRAEKELAKAIPKDFQGLRLEELFPVLVELPGHHQAQVQGSELYQDLVQLLHLKELKAKLDIGIKEVFLPKPHISAMESITYEYPLLKRPEKIQNPRVKAEYHNVKRRIYIFQLDWGNAEIHIRAFLGILDQNQPLRDELAREAVEMTEMLMRLEIEKGDYEQVNNLVPTLFHYGIHRPELSIKKEIAYYAIRVTQAINCGDQKLGKEIIEPFLNCLRKVKGEEPVSRIVTLWFSLAQLCGMLEKWEKANQICGEALSLKRKANTTNSWKYLLLFHCITSLEVNNLWNLETALETASKKLRTEKNSYLYFQRFFELFFRLLQTDPAGWDRIFKEGFAQFGEIEDHSVEALHFNYLDLLGWFQSKAKNIPWILVEKAKSIRNTSQYIKNEAG